MPVRQPIDDSLGQAQTARTDARHAWIDLLVDQLITVFPERADLLEVVRVELKRGSEEYAEKLNNADLALINRVTVMLLNEQLAREAGDDELRALIQGGRRVYEGERE